MKKASVIFFSSSSQVSNIPNSQLFPELVLENTTVTLLTNDEKEINEVGLKDEVKSLSESEEDAIYLCPSVVKDRFQKIGLFGDSFIQKKPAEQEAELKRLVSEKIKVTLEQITFDEVIEFEFVQESPGPYEPTLPEETITGNSLKNLIKKNPKGLPLEKVRPILEAMKKLPDQDYNCIEPANICYDFEQKVAKVIRERQTQEREIIKSVEALADASDDSNNVYSLACITYELLSGKHPFGGKKANEVTKTTPLLQPNCLNKSQWEVLKEGLTTYRKDKQNEIIHTHTISEFLENFLRKTFYDFVKDMVEAPFFVGLVVGGGLLIFTITYLYFWSGGISSLELRQVLVMQEKVEAATVYDEAYHWVERIKKLKKDTTDLDAYLEVFRTTGKKPEEYSIASASLQKEREEKKVYIEKNSSMEKFVIVLLERLKPKEKSAQEKDYEEFFFSIKKFVSMSCSPRLSDTAEGWIKNKLNQISTWCNNNECSNFETELDNYKSSISNQCPKNVGGQESESKGGQQ